VGHKVYGVPPGGGEGKVGLDNHIAIIIRDFIYVYIYIYIYIYKSIKNDAFHLSE